MALTKFNMAVITQDGACYTYKHHGAGYSVFSTVDRSPDSRYEASLVLVPPPRAVVGLFDPSSVEFVTQPYIG